MSTCDVEGCGRGLHAGSHGPPVTRKGPDPTRTLKALRAAAGLPPLLQPPQPRPATPEDVALARGRQP